MLSSAAIFSPLISSFFRFRRLLFPASVDLSSFSAEVFVFEFAVEIVAIVLFEFGVNSKFPFVGVL